MIVAAPSKFSGKRLENQSDPNEGVEHREKRHANPDRAGWIAAATDETPEGVCRL
jgi:hypothetical protein